MVGQVWKFFKSGCFQSNSLCDDSENRFSNQHYIRQPIEAQFLLILLWWNLNQTISCTKLSRKRVLSCLLSRIINKQAYSPVIVSPIHSNILHTSFTSSHFFCIAMNHFQGVYRLTLEKKFLNIVSIHLTEWKIILKVSIVICTLVWLNILAYIKV